MRGGSWCASALVLVTACTTLQTTVQTRNLGTQVEHRKRTVAVPSVSTRYDGSDIVTTVETVTKCEETEVTRIHRTEITKGKPRNARVAAVILGITGAGAIGLGVGGSFASPEGRRDEMGEEQLSPQETLYLTSGVLAVASAVALTYAIADGIHVRRREVDLGPSEQRNVLSSEECGRTPVANATVVVVSADGSTVATGMTDATGEVRISGEKVAAILRDHANASLQLAVEGTPRTDFNVPLAFTEELARQDREAAVAEADRLAQLAEQALGRGDHEKAKGLGDQCLAKVADHPGCQETRTAAVCHLVASNEEADVVTRWESLEGLKETFDSDRVTNCVDKHLARLRPAYTKAVAAAEREEKKQAAEEARLAEAQDFLDELDAIGGRENTFGFVTASKLADHPMEGMSRIEMREMAASYGRIACEDWNRVEKEFDRKARTAATKVFCTESGDYPDEICQGFGVIECVQITVADCQKVLPRLPKMCGKR